MPDGMPNGMTPRSRPTAAEGSGFISADGYAVTNNHVSIMPDVQVIDDGRTSAKVTAPTPRLTSRSSRWTATISRSVAADRIRASATGDGSATRSVRRHQYRRRRLGPWPRHRLRPL
jgi:S1-C subfamily serine protease